MERRMKVTNAHWDLLLDFLELHPELINGKVPQSATKPKLTKLWQQLAHKLNNLNQGTKTADKWKSAMQDWKYHTKMKVIDIIKNGNEALTKKLSAQEQRLVALIGWRLIKDSDIQIPPVSDRKPILEALNIGPRSFNESPFEGAYSNHGEFELIEPKIEPGLTPNSPPPLIPFEGKSLPDNNEEGEEQNARGTKRKRCESPEGPQKEIVDVLKVMAKSLQGILQELRVISEVLKPK